MIFVKSSYNTNLGYLFSIIDSIESTGYSMRGMVSDHTMHGVGCIEYKRLYNINSYYKIDLDLFMNSKGDHVGSSLYDFLVPLYRKQKRKENINKIFE